MNHTNKAKLGKRIIEWVDSADWDASQAYLDAHQADLLTDAADAVFAFLLARDEATPDDLRILTAHRALLARARAAGIPAAYAELASALATYPDLPLLPVPLLPTLRHLQSLSPARLRAYLDEHPGLRDTLMTFGVLNRQQNTSVESVILRFINANSWEEKRRIVEQNPRALFGPAAVIFFEEHLARAAGDEVNTMVLQAHQRLLTRCQEIGIAEAFQEADDALRQARDDGHDILPPRHLN